MISAIIGVFGGITLAACSFCFQMTQERLADVYLESTATHIVYHIENLQEIYNNGR